MPPELDFLVTAFKVVTGIVAFIALMQLFPICIRLGQIRDKLYAQEIAKEKAERERREAENPNMVTGRPSA